MKHQWDQTWINSVTQCECYDTDILIDIFILKSDILIKVSRTMPTPCLGIELTPSAFIKKLQK